MGENRELRRLVIVCSVQLSVFKYRRLTWAEHLARMEEDTSTLKMLTN
jgi:hypothetical protein